MENETFARAPFAISNEWGEWFWAVFLLEALAALVVAVVFSVRKKEDAIPGLRFERVVYYLCVPQIFCESLRALGMRWGFVRIEQVLCGVIIEALLIYGCLRYKEPAGFWKRWPRWSRPWCLPCAKRRTPFPACALSAWCTTCACRRFSAKACGRWA